MRHESPQMVELDRGRRQRCHSNEQRHHDQTPTNGGCGLKEQRFDAGRDRAAPERSDGAVKRGGCQRCPANRYRDDFSVATHGRHCSLISATFGRQPKLVDQTAEHRDYRRRQCSNQQVPVVVLAKVRPFVSEQDAAFFSIKLMQ